MGTYNYYQDYADNDRYTEFQIELQHRTEMNYLVARILKRENIITPQIGLEETIATDEDYEYE